MRSLVDERNDDAEHEGSEERDERRDGIDGTGKTDIGDNWLHKRVMEDRGESKGRQGLTEASETLQFDGFTTEKERIE